MATAFEAPKERKPEAPQETLLTILLHPAPMNTLFTSLCIVIGETPAIGFVSRRRLLVLLLRLKKTKIKQAGLWVLLLLPRAHLTWFFFLKNLTYAFALARYHGFYETKFKGIAVFRNRDGFI
jgi:hypothetical protein